MTWPRARNHACVDCGAPTPRPGCRCAACGPPHRAAERRRTAKPWGKPSPLRERWRDRLPAQRPPTVPEREWSALVAFVAGRRAADVAADLGLTLRGTLSLLRRAGELVATPPASPTLRARRPNSRPASSRATPDRPGRRHPLITDEGFAPHAIATDPDTGCWIWQGSLSRDGTPHAAFRGRHVSVRRLAYQRSGKPLAAGVPLRPSCGNRRCVNPDHAEPRHRAATPRARARPRGPKPRWRPFAADLPVNRPASVSERQWRILRAVASGRTLAEVGNELGISRQAVHAALHAARRKLPRRRHLRPLADPALTAILTADPTESTAALARRLGHPYHTVHKARARFAAGWGCAIAWTDCAECGQPLAGAAAHPRTVHPGCERARAARRGRQRRQRGDPSARSTPYVARWRLANPETAVLHREREKATRRDRWPTLPDQERAAALAKAHAADARDDALTRDRAHDAGQPWTADEDRVVVERGADPAREVALALGRTIWAVRHRRVRLRQRGLMPPPHRAGDPAKTP